MEPELDKMGSLPEPEWHKIWPSLDVPDLTSPPRGRTYSSKNIHNLSFNSDDEENAPKKKKIGSEPNGSSSSTTTESSDRASMASNIEPVNVKKTAAVFNVPSKRKQSSK